MPKNFEKIRKLNPLEEFYDVAVSQFNFMIASYWLQLDSRQPINPTVVQQALSLLFRYTDNLSLCIRNIEETSWFCRMAEEKIDFEVLRKKFPRDIMEEEITKNFNSEDGPLWRAKLVFENNEANESSANEKPSNICNILFTFHHAIMDGFTTFNMCNNFLKILNDLVEGTVKETYEGLWNIW
ncbi:hypothetical protein Avbf_09251 [Armadillidium vulgare]|nr:hypothetical protein Avbf_09251 [Armadillidium vulgare]